MLINGAQLTGTNVQNLSIGQSRLTKVNLAESRLPRFDLHDVEIADCNLSNLKSPDGLFRRTIFSQSKLTGINLAGSSFGDVEFVNCIIDFALFERATLKQVTFRNCQMRDVSFANTTFDRVAFIECDLGRASFDRVRTAASEMRHCTMNGMRGLNQLSGMAMEWNDILAHADLFAGALGITVAGAAGEDGP